MKHPIQAIVTSISTKVDRSTKIILELNEMSAEEKADLFGDFEKAGWFFFKESMNDPIEVPDVKVEKWQKTPSQRLRAVIYRIWEKSKSEDDFEVYYLGKMERLIEQLKEKL